MNLRAAPKDPRANLRYRKYILERAADDPDLQEEIWIRCSRDLIYFIDVFGWIYAPKDHSDCPDRPFVTYDFQENALRKMDKALGKHDLLGEKSRDMGFTWMVIALFAWRFIFRKKQSFLLGSRKEEYVDKSGDPKTLFWKIDYFIEHLPGWMQPMIHRTDRHIHNLDMNSTIDGESTNDNFARGDRRVAIALDEFPSVENGQSIAKAAGDASNCVIYFGTSSGASGAFYEIREKMLEEHPERIIRLHWSEHPEKKKGLYTSIKGTDGAYHPHILDPNYHFADGYKFRLDGKLRSPAYDERESRAPNRRVMAQEWDIDYLASAWQWFGAEKISALKNKCRPPSLIGDIHFDPDWKHPRWLTNPLGGKVQWWGEVETDDEDRKHPIVPKDWHDVACACDIGMGTAGEYSSNSVACFYRRSTGEKIAQFTVNDMDPTEFCRRVLGLCVLFNNCYLGWESNGPGSLFTSEVKKAGYRNVYYSEKNLQKFDNDKTSNPGWHSNKESKIILLTDYANALIDARITNFCAEALDECGQYIHEPGGVIIHAKAKAQGREKDDPTEVGENHGDMVIADALANFLIQDLTKREIDEPETEEPPPPGSFGARSLEAREAFEKKPRRWGRYKPRARQDAFA
jgi:hypothetical protein